jgi:hypothetical protein
LQSIFIELGIEKDLHYQVINGIRKEMEKEDEYNHNNPIDSDLNVHQNNNDNNNTMKNDTTKEIIEQKIQRKIMENRNNINRYLKTSGIGTITDPIILECIPNQ